MKTNHINAEMDEETKHIMQIADTLIDQEYIKNAQAIRIEWMKDDVLMYKRMVIILGYCSRIHNYMQNRETSIAKILLCRREILHRYRDIYRFMDKKTFMAITKPPMTTQWYYDGKEQYNKTVKICIEYYKRKIHKALLLGDEKKICKIIDRIIKWDNYYDIYEKTIGLYISQNKMFANIMNKKYMSYIQL